MKICLTLIAAFCLPTTAYTQDIPVRPGLWEHTMVLSSESGRVELALELARTQIALLPPQQRQMVEGIIKAQGIKVDWVNQIFQNCISEIEVASGKFQFADNGGCIFTEVQNKGFITDIAFTCDQGQGSLVLADGIEYSGQSTMTLNFNGLIELASATHSGRWLGSSCAALQ